MRCVLRWEVMAATRCVVGWEVMAETKAWRGEEVVSDEEGIICSPLHTRVLGSPAKKVFIVHPRLLIPFKTRIM
ncbi:hypothetical protein Pyn_21493 [Prunus yedoensis var. nudiflora]|uniref:Uncharacterized protein n=1 Tax=Prunus yedoensis var. nudiflora TaxID=2094558 RepID=A0A314UAZ1_PRUYE|nr:hypothetical protein Pyn_21493 [Prunus yedoensis var. nudiflora]